MTTISELAKFANNLVAEKNNLDNDYLVFREEMQKKEIELSKKQENLEKNEMILNESRKELAKEIDSLNTTKILVENMKREAQQLAQKGNCDIEIWKKIRKENEDKSRL